MAGRFRKEKLIKYLIENTNILLCDDNSAATITLFRARTGTLKQDILMVIHIVKYVIQMIHKL